MKFINDPTEKQIFNALISRRPTFKINCIEFKEKVIVGTDKERERNVRQEQRY